MEEYEIELTAAQMKKMIQLQHTYADYPDAMSTQDVMKMLGVGRGYVFQMKKSGLLRCFKIGNRLIYPKKWVLEYLVIYALEDQLTIENYRNRVLGFCRTRKTITQIAVHLNLSVNFCRKYILEKLCEDGMLICEVLGRQKRNFKALLYNQKTGKVV